jgi:threonine dehydrogenase-like Zn-dependent dehydrogenase
MRGTVLYGPRKIRFEDRETPKIVEPTDAIVLGTGWFAADAANVKPGSTVAVVGDGAVGLLGVLSARQMGAERIIAMSRHTKRQALAREFGATDIVTERGNDGVARIMDMTKGIGADSVLECVGTQESMMQAIHSTRPGGYVGYVGVPHGVELNGEELFFEHVHLHGGQAGRDALAWARFSFWARFNFLVIPAGSRKYGGGSCNPSVLRSYFAPA